MNRMIFTCWCCCMVLLAHAQVLTVKDQESGLPLENATLSSTNPKVFLSTNAKGQADISALNGAEKIEIRYFGYKTLVQSYAELSQAQFMLALIPSNISLDQVVISATRWNQNRRDIPSKVSIISSRDMVLQNPQTAADLLGASGEVFIQKSQQGGGSPMIRGFSTNRLLYAIDGVRMNTAIFRSGNIQNVISLDPFATERTEVFFGPGSIIYGSDAIGGVMSFETLSPKFSSDENPLITGKALSRFSSANNEKTAHFDLNVGWKKWALVSSFSSFDFEDLRMGRFGPREYLRPFYVQRQNNTDVVVTNDDPLVQRPTGYKQINLMQKVRFQPSDRWDFQYAFHYSSTSDYSRYDRHIRLRNGLPRSGEFYYGPQVWMMNLFNITHTAKKGLYDQMTIRLAQQFFEESRVDRDLNRTERRIRVEKVGASSANFDFLKSFGTKHKLFYGLEGVIDEVESTGTNVDVSNNKETVGPSRYPQSTWSSYAAYLNYQWKASDKFVMQTGIRFNNFVLDADFSNNLAFYPFPFSTAELKDGAVTGSLGFVFNPTDKLSITANASTGFRSPNVDDVGKVFDSTPGSVVIPNPDLEAEYAYNFELGIAKVFAEVLKIDLTGFYTTLENAMVRRNYTLNGQSQIDYNGTLSQVQAIQNAAVANVYGIQAGLELKIAKGLSFSSQFNVQEGEEELDNGEKSPSRHAAPWFGISRLTYLANGLNLQFYAQYSGEVSYENLSDEGRATDYIYAIDAEGRPYSPSWYTLNFKALYPINERFTLTAGVENLSDQRYRPYSSGIVAPGRNVILALSVGF
ncbi:TonB-dependent receptor [Haliscomenobacter hydrossis]|uniref:TonB-dependent receptor n=1 Tax=Haliscomenobacter hydrossis (strain ATCC 27775 / DSM 1100 / LMG 10767 / O) TaxID=760192 RepID=F4L1F8_HALH1|nr:TonB-dependent receptor [Haliscomenobacter hydrossis]AEE53855.1 TonB-dependent receptor [Haliscomenobacter hydrossis DSM 1100]